MVITKRMGLPLPPHRGKVPQSRLLCYFLILKLLLLCCLLPSASSSVGESEEDAGVEAKLVCESPEGCDASTEGRDPLAPTSERCDRDPGASGKVQPEDPIIPDRLCPCVDQAYVWAFENRTMLATDTVARLLAGPLTLLAVLRNKRWTDRVKHIQNLGELRIHVLGADHRLEPYMLWEEVLVGRRSAWSKMVGEVLASLGLHTPFEGLDLELTINGYQDDFGDSCLEVVNGRSGIECTQGRYINKIGRKPRTPHFAVMMNAGLMAEPGHWQDTLVHLLRKKVPFVVTNYNAGWIKRATNPTLPAVDYSSVQSGVTLNWVGHRFRPSKKLLSCRRRRLGDLTTLELLDGRIIDGHPNPFFYADDANTIHFANAELLVVQGRIHGKSTAGHSPEKNDDNEDSRGDSSSDNNKKKHKKNSDSSNNDNKKKSKKSNEQQQPDDGCYWCDVPEKEFFRESLKRDLMLLGSEDRHYHSKEEQCLRDVMEFINNEENFTCPGCDEGFTRDYRDWLAQTYDCIT